MERATQIARRNNYPFLQPKHLELLMEVNMASRAKHGWSALQSAFTAPKFSATAGDALTNQQLCNSHERRKDNHDFCNFNFMEKSRGNGIS
jgi:hypothetical protein